MNPSKIQLSFKDILLEFDPDNLQYSISTEKTKWETKADFSPYIVLQEKKDNLSNGERQDSKIDKAEKEKEENETIKALLYFKDAKSKRARKEDFINTIYRSFC